MALPIECTDEGIRIKTIWRHKFIPYSNIRHVYYKYSWDFGPYRKPAILIKGESPFDLYYILSDNLNNAKEEFIKRGFHLKPL